MKAWVFRGNRGSHVKVSGKALNIGGESFTMATFLYQDVLRDGPIMEYSGVNYGTHMWIHRKRLYIDFQGAGRNTKPYHVTPAPKKWHFVGVSLNAKTGEMVMWVDHTVVVKKVSVGARDMTGDLYIGLRPKDRRYFFNGRLAGTTLMNCATTRDKITTLRKATIRKARAGM